MRPDDQPRRERDDRPGRLERIWLKRFKGGPMDPVDAASLDALTGLIGNANRGRRRQVTIISRERWAELMRDLGARLPPSTRRANVMVSGIDLQNSRGRILRIGSTRLLINGETKPCEQMEAAHAGLQALMRERWGGGAFAEVIDGGDIRVGDVVELTDSDLPPKGGSHEGVYTAEATKACTRRKPRRRVHGGSHEGAYTAEATKARNGGSHGAHQIVSDSSCSSAS